MALLLSNVSNALTKVLLPYIQDNFNKNTLLLDKLKRNDGVVAMNDNFYAPIRTSRHGGITNLANDGSSLVTSKASIGQASVAVKILTGTFDISKLVLDATSSSKLAVTSQLQFQAESLANDFAKNINRQFFSDGLGYVASAIGSVAATVVNVEVMGTAAQALDGRVSDIYGTVNGDIGPTDYIFPDMILGFGSVAGSGVGTVSAVSGTSVTMTAALTVNMAGSSPISILDGSGTGSGTSEVQGVRLALSSGTANYAGVARTSQGWTPQLGTTSAALTLTLMESKYLNARKFGQVGDTYAIFANITLYQKYADLLTSMRRSVNTVDLIGGWSGIEFQAGAGKVAVYLDYDVPDGEVEILNLDSWTVCQVSDLGWMESPNEGALVRRPDKITYQATMAWFANLMCRAPGANGRLTQKTS